MDNQEIQRRIEELERIVKSLTSSTTIPYNIAKAFERRLNPVLGDSNATDPSTVTQAVNEAGSGTYNVATVPAGFITIVVNGNSRTVPYY